MNCLSFRCGHGLLCKFEIFVSIAQCVHHAFQGWVKVDILSVKCFIAAHPLKCGLCTLHEMNPISLYCFKVRHSTAQRSQHCCTHACLDIVPHRVHRTSSYICNDLHPKVRAAGAADDRQVSVEH